MPLAASVFSTLGRFPETDDSCQRGNVSMEVIDAERRRINRISVRVNRTVNMNG